MGKLTNKELDELEKRSFENLVRFYEKELLMLARGRKTQLSKYTFRMLKKRGVLGRGRHKRIRRRISGRAMQVLEKLAHSRNPPTLITANTSFELVAYDSARDITDE